jgi:hypothetical protein
MHFPWRTSGAILAQSYQENAPKCGKMRAIAVRQGSDNVLKTQEKPAIGRVVVVPRGGIVVVY